MAIFRDARYRTTDNFLVIVRMNENTLCLTLLDKISTSLHPLKRWNPIVHIYILKTNEYSWTYHLCIRIVQVV